MLTCAQIIKILRQEYPVLSKDFGVKKIAIFGSFANGTPNSKSDVDIIVEFAKNPGLKFIKMCAHIEKCLGRKTDVLTLAGLKSIRSKSISQSIRKNLIYV